LLFLSYKPQFGGHDPGESLDPLEYRFELMRVRSGVRFMIRDHRPIYV